MSFEQLGVIPELLRTIHSLRWFRPTAVQEESIPLILGGGDVIVAADTGSGKTASFVIPLLQLIHETKQNSPSSQDIQPTAATPQQKDPDPYITPMAKHEQEEIVAKLYTQLENKRKRKREWLQPLLFCSTPCHADLCDQQQCDKKTYWAIQNRDIELNWESFHGFAKCLHDPFNMTNNHSNSRRWLGARASIALSKGKWFYEVSIQDIQSPNQNNELQGQQSPNQNENLSKMLLEKDNPLPLLIRLGWSAALKKNTLGTAPDSFGFGSTGTIVTNGQFSPYGGSGFAGGDTVGVFVDWDQGHILYALNGVWIQPHAFTFDPQQTQPLHPAIAVRNACATINLGTRPFAFPYTQAWEAGFRPVTQAQIHTQRNKMFPQQLTMDNDHDDQHQEKHQGHNGTQSQANNVPQISKNKIKKLLKMHRKLKAIQMKPMAIIIEPTKDLSDQVDGVLKTFTKSFPHNPIVHLCLVGGQGKHESGLNNKADILVITPGRLTGLVENELLALDHLRFLVLDEVDQLTAPVKKEHPSDDPATLVSKFVDFLDASRENQSSEAPVLPLQVLLFSATAHTQGVKNLSSRLQKFPTWVDVVSGSLIPATIRHVLVYVHEDESNIDTSPNHWVHQHDLCQFTDGVHVCSTLSTFDDSNKASVLQHRLSQQTKIKKLDKLVELIETFQIYQALIFVRTKNDADALERFLCFKGQGTRFNYNSNHNDCTPSGTYSCAALHSGLRWNQRRASLNAFQKSHIRFLISTDVAARGIDVPELPYLINLAFPSDPQVYIHRCGRVGRANHQGYAISIVTNRPELVWYHREEACRTKNCTNRTLKEIGGCITWLNDTEMIEMVQHKLGEKIEVLSDVKQNEQVFLRRKVVRDKNLLDKTEEENSSARMIEADHLVQLEENTQKAYVTLLLKRKHARSSQSESI